MTSNYNQLAIVSGTPAFSTPLHVGRPNIGNREKLMGRINQILDSQWFTNNGPFLQEFEQKAAEYLGVRNFIALCNGTIALEIAIRALELKGEVIIPSFTFIATAHALQWQEITPVFCDVVQGGHHMDPEKIEKLITPHTTGIIGVHVWGETCGIEELNEIARNHKIRLMFDAAHAFGASHNRKMVGNYGDLEVFSFHATKFFNTFEGGAITTNDDALATKIRDMRNFGFAGYDQVKYLGINGKMTEICAAMGLTSLESIDDIISINKSNYFHYRNEIKDIPGVRIYPYNGLEKRNYQYIIFEINETITRISRDLLVTILHAENVLARRYFYPGCHQMEPYRSYFPNAGLLLPETEHLTQCVMSLPNGASINQDIIHTLCNIIRVALENGEELTARFGNNGKFVS